MNKARTWKVITGILEIVLGIPVLGGLIVMSLAYVPLGIMLILHIVTLVVSRKAGVKSPGSILGIVTSCLAVIPVVGMILHLITGILLVVNAATQKAPQNNFAA